MRSSRRRLEELSRRLDAPRELDDADDFAPIPYRLYEVDDATGQRVFVEPDEGELALADKFAQLVQNGRWRG